MPRLQTLTLTRGDDRAVGFILRESRLAGWAATLTMRTQIDAPEPVLTTGSVVNDDGTIVFRLTHDMTVGLPLGRLLADVQLTSPEGIVASMTPDGNPNYDPVFTVIVYGDITTPDHPGGYDDEE